jgi:hypothetical protein
VDQHCFEKIFLFFYREAVMSILAVITRCFLLGGLMFMAAPRAALGEIITYSLVNVPSLQGGYTLSGTLVLDTTNLPQPSPGKWTVGQTQESEFTSWSFNVSGTPSYSVNYTDPNALLDITHGGSASLIATRTSLEVEPDASFQIGINTGSWFTSVIWQNRLQPSGTSQYFSNSSGTQRWFQTDSTTLTNAFASGVGGGWVMATAVPEPSAYAMAVAGMAACCGAILRKRLCRFA